jgi:hypothetical protein
MLRFIQQSGPFILLQAALALVVLTLALVNTVRLAIRDPERVVGLTRSIDAILFWGSLTAIFGFLGQWNGLYKAANALMDYGLANPKLIVLGFGESLGTSVFGLFALVVAAFLWFGLRVAQHWKTAG